MADRSSSQYDGLLHRFGNPLEWKLAYRVALIALIAFSFTAWTVIIARYLMAHRAVADYVSRPLLSKLLFVEERVFAIGWVVYMAVGLTLGKFHRQGRGVRFLANSEPFFYVLHVLAVAYCLGFFTTIYFGTTLLSGVTVGMVLLEPTAVVLAMLSMIAGAIILTLATQVHWIPYAPLILQTPFKDGVLSPTWLATFGGFDSALLLFLFGLILLVLQRWRLREEQLIQANRFLTRFLSPQVARIANQLGMAAVMQKSRSQLTAIECDLRGFTAFSESVAPEEVVDLLERYYSAIGEAVGEHGGTIKDYSGDGVLVLVGAPVPYPDHARRAVLIASSIRERVTKILSAWKNLGLELQVGVGLAGGYVTVGAIGGAERLEYVAVGPAVNLASRLCERAAGNILVDQRVVSLLGENPPFHFEPVETATIKGFSRPVKVFELITPNGDILSADEIGAVADNRSVAQKTSVSTGNGDH